MSGARLVNCRKRGTVAVDQLQWQWQQVFGCGGKPRAGRIPGESSKRPAVEAETWKLTIGQKIGNAVEIKESCILQIICSAYHLACWYFHMKSEVFQFC